MKKFLEQNEIYSVDFLYNNSFFFEDKIIAGTKGCNEVELEKDKKILNREVMRLELSIKDGIKKYGEDKDIIIFMHYPPFTAQNDFINIMKKYNINRCYYGHLHGESLKEAVKGNIDGIEHFVVSCDNTDFKLWKVC